VITHAGGPWRKPLENGRIGWAKVLAAPLFAIKGIEDVEQEFERVHQATF
jgi:hypothetical protein